MAEFDSFTGAETGNGEKDLVADFLSREQDTLAELGEDEFGGFGGQSAPRTEYGDPFGGGQEYGNVTSTQDDSDIFGGQSSEYGQTEDPYNQVKQMDRQRAEPEKIRIWREQQVEMLQKKDAESEKKKAEWREIARRELEEWYKHRNEQVDKAQKVNRQAPQGENEDAFVQQRDERKPGGEWERVCRLCDFNPKGSRNTKDVGRMRSILLQLKQTPVER